MKRIYVVLGILLLFIAGGYLVSNQQFAYSKLDPGSNQPGNTQTSFKIENYISEDQGQGGVWIQALYLTNSLAQAIDIGETYESLNLNGKTAVVFWGTTHSGDLTRFDFLNNSFIEINGNRLKPLDFRYINQDSHHPQGMLIFEKIDPEQINQGNQLILGIENLAGAPLRTLNLKLPSN